MQKALLERQSQVKSRLESAFNEYIDNQSFSESKLLSALKYSLFNGGKRVRPLLVSLVADMLGASEQDANVVALAVECIHAYSLVHDDLPAMDNDELRRGQPTCHIQFDEATAILAGDSLQTLAFELLANMPMQDFASTKRVELILELSKASGINGMCQGQSLDLIATDNSIEIDALTELHSLKTGALLRASARMAVLISEDANTDVIDTLTRFAEHIGLAFQIQDDILDVTSDTQTLGKPQGSDEALHKTTFVSLLGLQGAEKELKHHHKQALNALNALQYDTSNLKMFSDFMLSRTF